jgi:hypothetical protein
MSDEEERGKAASANLISLKELNKMFSSGRDVDSVGKLRFRDSSNYTNTTTDNNKTIKQFVSL